LREASASKLIEESKTAHFVLIVHEKPSSQTLPQLLAKDEELLPLGGMLQCFLHRELFINPTRHHMVPKHERLEEAQVKELMDFFQIKSKAQLPSIHRSDPIAVWLGLRPGDVVRITRVSPTSGESFYYRCCVTDRTAKPKA
jgi:DNA-directed RNA polymerase subunit H (RpoH/RPB5)